MDRPYLVPGHLTFPLLKVSFGLVKAGRCFSPNRGGPRRIGKWSSKEPLSGEKFDT
jgi:hypothetical protein